MTSQPCGRQGPTVARRFVRDEPPFAWLTCISLESLLAQGSQRLPLAISRRTLWSCLASFVPVR